jgi:hypothetical protein
MRVKLFLRTTFEISNGAPMTYTDIQARFIDRSQPLNGYPAEGNSEDVRTVTG